MRTWGLAHVIFEGILSSKSDKMKNRSHATSTETEIHENMTTYSNLCTYFDVTVQTLIPGGPHVWFQYLDTSFISWFIRRCACTGLAYTLVPPMCHALRYSVLSGQSNSLGSIEPCTQTEAPIVYPAAVIKWNSAYFAQWLPPKISLSSPGQQ